MSEWIEIKDKNNIEIEDDMISIYIAQNYAGSIYVSLPLHLMKKIISEFEGRIYYEK